MDNKFSRIIILFSCLMCTNVYSQEKIVLFNEAESLSHFPEGIYKEELEIFTIKGSNPKGEDSDYFRKAIVKKIKDGHADLIPIEHAYNNQPLSIVIEGNKDTTSIKSIFFTFMKFYRWIPESALCDIVNPTFSVYWIKDKAVLKDYYKKLHILTPWFLRYKPRQVIDNWEVYTPQNGHRMYIHMVNYKYQYEVTWIIDGNKYVGRVIDKL